ncbi:MAG: 30S ribosomal protein S13 [Euryarchaeota archaeon]|nr:30S ribosomal protein S13 [Euryarchaeota archaeon]
MDDVSKPNEEMPKTPDEKVVDEESKESDSKTENETEETSEEVEESEKEEQAEEEVKEEPEKQETEKPQEKAEKPARAESKKEGKKEEPKKKDDHRPDFRYIVRIANTDLNGEKNLVNGLTTIRGIGVRMGIFIADTSGIDRNVKVGDLTETQIEKIKEVISNLNKTAPGWMLNHRRDYETGENMHFVSSDIDIRLRDEINIMKKIRSYRGVRHEMGLRVRGQRTKTHGRVGLALGVSRKAAKAAAAAQSSDKGKGEKKKE